MYDGKRFICGFEKLSDEGKKQVMKLMAWLDEQAEIEKKFKLKPSASLCRKCRQKTKYTLTNYGGGNHPGPCEICGKTDCLIGINSSWAKGD